MAPGDGVAAGALALANGTPSVSVRRKRRDPCQWGNVIFIESSTGGVYAPADREKKTRSAFHSDAAGACAFQWCWHTAIFPALVVFLVVFDVARCGLDRSVETLER
jgi:hypothetical protein